ncbi:hypothetical protein CBW65_12915 [Tumebacillus avium]|uniref:DJ-1/PfpI domain-containing protein n=1 Tax=Tumebacillus avium TaxID=1903704 RepID=A0A1Y0IMT4_9BACL|nr:DJ-1/PfpI family protein [Tumebacillus avium]ARU61831.1 hypothetical protein CBW65_12915 [Tumebacillus avium]
MKALILLFDGYAEFEVNLVGLFFNGDGNEVVMTADRDEVDYVTGGANFRTVPHVKLSEVNPAEYDVLAIPGGSLTHLLDHEPVLNLIRAFHREGKVIGAICAGPALLGAAGVLGDHSYTTSYSPENHEVAHLFNWETCTGRAVTVDGNLVTAKGNGYVEFAVALAERVNMFDSPEEKEGTLDYFKNRLPDEPQVLS